MPQLVGLIGHVVVSRRLGEAVRQPAEVTALDQETAFRLLFLVYSELYIVRTFCLVLVSQHLGSLCGNVEVSLAGGVFAALWTLLSQFAREHHV